MFSKRVGIAVVHAPVGWGVYGAIMFVGRASMREKYNFRASLAVGIRSHG